MQAAASSVQSLRSALRSSPWLLIAVALHALVLLILSVVYVVQRHTTVEKAPEFIQVRPLVERETWAELPEVRVPRYEIPPDTGELVSDEAEILPPPLWADESDVPVDLTAPIGDPLIAESLPGGASGASNIGVSENGVGNYGHGPSAYWGRGTGDGPSGGRRPLDTPIRTEEAVLQGLRWLVRHQNEDGSWSAATLADHCTLGRPCADAAADYSPQYDPGLTALALLAFLGHGLDGSSKVKIVDDVRGESHKAGTVVLDGLRWLKDAQGPDGSFRDYPGSLYNEAIGALALSEAYGLSGNRQLKEPAEQMIRYLVAAQKANPFGTGRWGWRYTPGGDTIADTSVTGWVVMALKSAELSGLQVPRDTLDGALDFARWATGKDGLVGYLDPSGAGEKVTGHGDHFDYHVGTMSALGMLVRTFAAHDIADPFLDLAAQQIARDLPAVSEDRLSVDYYYWYYGSLALNQYDGPDSPRPDHGRYWKPWNEAMIAALLALQDANAEKDACSRGGWLVPDRWSHAGGPVYGTALNVLTLEVYYRYENAFGSTAGPRKPR